jgi:RimJ/RimL family protein N-acetyltransferase
VGGSLLVTRIEGERVTLRPFRAEEYDVVLARYATEDAEHTEIRRRRVALSGTRTTWELLFAIEASGQLAGEVQARCPEDAAPPGVFEIGIELYDANDRGRGLGTEVLRVLTGHLFERERAIRVQATTDVGNASMRRSLEKCGFTHEGVLRGFMPTADGPRDYAMYGITAKDWTEPSRLEPRR